MKGLVLYLGRSRSQLLLHLGSYLVASCTTRSIEQSLHLESLQANLKAMIRDALINALAAALQLS